MNNASVLAPERRTTGKGAGQLAQAQRMLDEARAELQRVVALLAEKAREHQALEEETRAVTATADVDRIMQMQVKIAKHSEFMRDLQRRRAEAQKSVDNKGKYVETLRLSIDNMRNEISYLEQRLEPKGHHARRIEALETDLELARSGKASEENRLAHLRRQIWMIVGAEPNAA
jgi:chromosome segregation ATPase